MAGTDTEIFKKEEDKYQLSSLRKPELDILPSFVSAERG
jgi:hypothetical protein